MLTSIRRKFLPGLFLGLSIVSATHADSFTPSGTVGTIKILSGMNGAPGNYTFRVFLTGNPTLCGNTNTWAYVNASDVNYAAIVAGVLSAKASGYTISLGVTPDSLGYCQIGTVYIY